MSFDRDVPTEYLNCRSWGHSWTFTTVDRVKGEFIQGMKCRECFTHREVRISTRTGLREAGNRYRYPEDLFDDVVPYKMPKGTGGPLTAEERGRATLLEIQHRYDELASRRGKRRRA